MTITCTPEEAESIRRGLKTLIKKKNESIRCINKHLNAEPDNEEATAIRMRMIFRREEIIDRAQRLLDDLDRIAIVDKGKEI